MDMLLEKLKKIYEVYELVEEKTQQLIGYHATTAAKANKILHDGVIKANPKNARWTANKGIPSLSDSVYIELDPVSALSYYGGHDEMSGLIIIQFTEKTALSDPKMDIEAFIYTYVKNKTNEFSDIIDNKTSKAKLNIDGLKDWCNKQVDDFNNQLHIFLSKSNEKVPNKITEINDLLYNYIIYTKYFEFGIKYENRIPYVKRYHNILKYLSDSYKGFKRTTSSAMRLPYDVGMTGRNRIIGILTSYIQTDIKRKHQWNDDAIEKEIKNSTFDVIYGNPKEIREKTGLIALGDYNDRQNYFWDKHQKEKAQKELERKERAKQKRKERDSLKKQQQNNP